MLARHKSQGSECKRPRRTEKKRREWRQEGKEGGSGTVHGQQAEGMNKNVCVKNDRLNLTPQNKKVNHELHYKYAATSRPIYTI